MTGIDAPPPSDPRANDDVWRGMLTGELRDIQQLRRFWRHVPSDPRCKLCWSPFGGVGSILSRLTNHGPAARNPLLCNPCARHIRDHPGGAEIVLSVLFADVRESTRVAEQMSPRAFRDLLQRFYRLASEAITTHDGIVDKFLGDGVMALFIPAFAGEDHAGRAVSAARALRDKADGMPEPRLPIGIGVHTGTAFAGAIGTEGDVDFSALGDAVNVASRLASAATAHQILVSRDSVEAAHLEAATGDFTTLELKGRCEPLEVATL